MKSEFQARVTKDSLVFSAAHFITFNGDICERLHGHNWRVDAGMEGQLDENHYVFDFIALRDGLMQIVERLDHRVLLPESHPEIHVEKNDGEVTAKFRDRRWVFPEEDACILPLANTTAERIAEWIGMTFLGQLPDAARAQVAALRVSVEENFGQWADCVLRPHD